MKKTILLLDPQLSISNFLSTSLGRKFEIIVSQTDEEMFKLLKINPVDLIMVPDGLVNERLVAKVNLIDKTATVACFGQVNSSSEVIDLFRLGVKDYFYTPIEVKEFKKRILCLTEDNDCSHKEENQITDRPQMLGVSSAMEKAKLAIINAGSLRILFLGETGVGKSAFARWSNHVISRKENRKRPFEHVNCANLKRDRFVDELFGHVKGAYTGAISDKRGLVELAEGGDLFLDEIGDLDLDCQAELLTFLDSYQYSRLGGTKRMKANIRVISATNKNLKKMVASGEFRKDLYSRLSQAVIKLPYLRERREDIQLFLKEFIRRYSGFDKPYDKEIERLYRSYPWTDGNVRELERACEYMCIQARHSDRIRLDHVDPIYSGRQIDYNFNCDASKIYEVGYKKIIREIERSVLEKTVAPTESIRRNAFRLGMDRASLSRKLAQYKIPVKYDHKFINNGCFGDTMGVMH